MASREAVALAGVGKRFGRAFALRDLSLTVPAGAFALVLGPNGAGKSTLLGILAGLLKPSAGRVVVLGGDPRRDARIRRNVGLLCEETMLYEHLSAEENLRFFARLYGIRDARQRIGRALDEVGLLSRADSLVHTFSRGMRQRLAWARTSLHSPRLLLLDEPFSGLDAESMGRLRTRLAEYRASGATCLVATHRPECVGGMADLRIELRAGRRVLTRTQGVESDGAGTRRIVAGEGGGAPWSV